MSETIRLHLGSGHRPLPNFINIDQDPLDHVDHVLDIKDLSIFEDNSVDEIYCCGVIIYFDRFQVKDVLKEWRRVLKTGGKLRISIADFEKMVQVYLNSGKVLESKMIYQTTTYDFKSLEKVLLDCDFSSVERYDWQDFLPEGFDDYSRAYIPHMDETGLHLSLNVVCEKI